MNAWSGLLDSRLQTATRVLENGIGGTKAERDQALAGALKEAKESLRVHNSIFEDGTSKKILTDIDKEGLPHDVSERRDELMSSCTKLLGVAVDSVCESAEAAVNEKVAAIRKGNAAGVVASIDGKVRPALEHLKKEGGPELTAEQKGRLDEAEKVVRAAAPAVGGDDDSD